MTPSETNPALPVFDPAAPVANIGMGVMGTKVAWACARAALPTRVFDIDAGKAKASRELALTWSAGAERETVACSMVVAETLPEALDGAQLAFENVPENWELKRKVLREIGGLLPEAAYMGTNASSLTCSPLAQASGRPDRFFNLNFTDPRTSKLVELMTCSVTAPATACCAALPRAGRCRIRSAIRSCWRQSSTPSRTVSSGK